MTTTPDLRARVRTALDYHNYGAETIHEKTVTAILDLIREEKEAMIARLQKPWKDLYGYCDCRPHDCECHASKFIEQLDEEQKRL